MLHFFSKPGFGLSGTDILQMFLNVRDVITVGIQRLGKGTWLPQRDEATRKRKKNYFTFSQRKTNFSSRR